MESTCIFDMSQPSHTDDSAYAGDERRAAARYRLVRPLRGFVEQDLERFAGSVLDVSASGFLLYAPGVAPDRFRGRGESDFGEVVFGEETIGGFGVIANVRELVQGTGIGFQWDDYVRLENGPLLVGLIDYLARQRLAGCVMREGARLRVAGHLSVALASDIHFGIAAGARALTLGETTSLDSSGLNLLLDLHKAGVGFEDVNPAIRESLARFHLVK